MTFDKSQRHKFLTIYGRKPVLEALLDKTLTITRLHLARSNRQEGIIDDILKAAKQRKVETVEHSKQELSRISRNGKQDQGVALDIHMPNFDNLDNFLTTRPKNATLLALEDITNPANLGMIIRSVCASGIDGLLLPETGCARLDSLVVKASAGTLFKCTIIRCRNLTESLQELKLNNFSLCALTGKKKQSLPLFEHQNPQQCIYLLGNESKGLSSKTLEAADQMIYVPMSNGVESLNVAACATLVAFHAGRQSQA